MRSLIDQKMLFFEITEVFFIYICYIYPTFLEPYFFIYLLFFFVVSYENGGANLEQTKSPLLKPAKQNAINEPLATLSFAGPAVKKQRD